MVHPYSKEVRPNELGFVGEHPSIQRICSLIKHVAKQDVTVNIQGESGTGKEFVARALHNYSPRNDNPFIAVNCGVFLTESLLEAELFGTERRVATGVDAYPGLLEQAHRGTLFLDEITEMTPRIQVALLRALQERKIVRIGGNIAKPRDIDLRLITASSRELDGILRPDFYYRVAQVPITLPPLRDRGDDIFLLSKYFCGRESDNTDKEFFLSDDSLGLLSNYLWPGNIRQLEYSIMRAIALYGLEDDDRDNVFYARHFTFLYNKSPESLPTYDDHMKVLIKSTLIQTNGNIVEAAKILDLNRRTIARKIEMFNIDIKSIRKK